MNGMATGATIEIAIACDLAAMARAQSDVAAFARERSLEPERVHELELVIDEVVSNIVRYGFPEGGANADICLEARVDQSTVALIFTDNGTPFDPLADAPAPDLTADVENRAVGGLGIHLVKTLADACAYRRDNGRNRLEVTWRRS